MEHQAYAIAGQFLLTWLAFSALCAVCVLLVAIRSRYEP
jgi:hypothetical protein